MSADTNSFRLLPQKGDFISRFHKCFYVYGLSNAISLQIDMKPMSVDSPTTPASRSTELVHLPITEWYAREADVLDASDHQNTFELHCSTRPSL